MLLLLWGLLLLCSVYLITPLAAFSPLFDLLPLAPAEQGMLLLLLMLPVYSWQQSKNRRLQQQWIQQQKEHKAAIKNLKEAHRKEESPFKNLMQSDQLAYWEWDIKNNQARFSPQWKKMLGIREEHPLNSLHDLQNRVHPKDQEPVQKQMLKILSGEHKKFECTHRVQHDDGHYIWVHDKGQIFYSPQGAIEKLSAIRLDVSEQKWIEEELELDATIIQHASDGIAIIDQEMRIIRCNNALTDSLNISRDDLQSMTFQQLLDAFQKNVHASVLEKLASETEWRGELTHTLADGSELTNIIAVQKIFHDTTQRIHYSLIQTDITDLKRSQQALDNLANIDSVTQLANRNRLYRELENNIEAQHPLTLLFIDLDNFKIVNDTLGHDIGDELLKKAASEIKGVAPENALTARIGGDEFVLFYPQESAKQPSSRKRTESSSEEQISRQLAESISERLSTPFEVQGHTLQIGGSIGMARFPQDAENRKSLLKAADQAMYQAKHHGKGQLRLFSELPKQDG